MKPGDFSDVKRLEMAKAAYKEFNRGFPNQNWDDQLPHVKGKWKRAIDEAIETACRVAQ